MTDNNFHLDREHVSDKMRRNREELYTLTFIRDYGNAAARYAIAKIGSPKFFEEIGKQRAQARLDGRITMDEHGDEHFNGKLDLAGFGFHAEQIAHIENLASSRDLATTFTGGVAAPVVSKAAAVAGSRSEPSIRGH